MEKRKKCFVFDSGVLKTFLKKKNWYRFLFSFSFPLIKSKYIRQERKIYNICNYQNNLYEIILPLLPWVMLIFPVKKVNMEVAIWPLKILWIEKIWDKWKDFPDLTGIASSKPCKTFSSAPPHPQSSSFQFNFTFAYFRLLSQYNNKKENYEGSYPDQSNVSFYFFQSFARSPADEIKAASALKWMCSEKKNDFKRRKQVLPPSSITWWQQMLGNCRGINQILI